MEPEHLKQALCQPVTRVVFELASDGIRWVLWNGSEQTYAEDAAPAQIHELVQATELLLELKLGVIPAGLKRFRAHRMAQQATRN